MSSPKPVRKAVFPVAGMGTRFLPATKAIPKEMLPVVDKPVIQYAVEEAREAGIEQFVFITGRGKHVIADHFDHAYELESLLSAREKTAELNSLLESLPKTGSVGMIRQQQPLGLGHAVWCARHFVGNEPFAVLLPDDLMVGKPGALTQMIKSYNEVGGGIIVAAEEKPKDEIKRYGVVDPGKCIGRWRPSRRPWCHRYRSASRRCRRRRSCLSAHLFARTQKRLLDRSRHPAIPPRSNLSSESASRRRSAES